MKIPSTILVAVALIIAGLTAAKAHAQAENPDALLKRLAAEYVPAEAQVAFVALPSEVLSRASRDEFPNQAATTAGLSILVVDPANIEIAMVFVVVSPENPPQWGMVVHTSTPLPVDGLMPELQTGEETIDGRPYQKATLQEGVSFARADDHTLIVAREPILRGMLTPKQDSWLRQQLAATTLKNDCTLVLSPNSLRKLLSNDSNTTDEESLLGQLSKLVSLVDRAELSFKLDSGQVARLTLTAAEKKNAAACVEILNTLPTKNAETIAAAIPDSTFDKSIDAAARRQVTNLIQQFLLGIDTRVVDDRVLIDSNVDLDAFVRLALLLRAQPVTSDKLARAQMLESTAQLQRIGRAIKQYEEKYGHFPLAYTVDGTGQPLLSWRVSLLPYLGEEELYRKFRLQEPWNSDHNRSLLAQMPSVYELPQLKGLCYTNYLVPFSANSVMGVGVPRRRDEIGGSGQSTTLVVEADLDQAVPWTKPQDLAASNSDPIHGLGGFRDMFGEYFLELKVSGTVLGTPLTNDPKGIYLDFTIPRRQR